MRIKVYPVKAKSRTYYRLKWKNAATGKWVYESTKHVRSRDAQRAAKEREDELNSRNPRGDGSTTWDIAVDRYRDEHHSGNAQSTWTRPAPRGAAPRGVIPIS